MIHSRGNKISEHEFKIEIKQRVALKTSLKTTEALDEEAEIVRYKLTKT